MKKALLISYYYPPRPGIGSERPYRLAKYLLNYGWSITVLTAKLPSHPPKGIRVIETDYIDILSQAKLYFGLKSNSSLHKQLGLSEIDSRMKISWKSKIIKLLKQIIAYPDDQRGWGKYAFRIASNLLEEEKFDVIISTSYPVTAHLIAKKLKGIYKTPWVADLRDPWTQNHFYEKYALIKLFEKKLELRTLSYADILITVTTGFADKLKLLHKHKQIICITNGYDSDDFPTKKITLSSKFTITYSGSLYNGKRHPFMLFEALSALVYEEKINRKLIEVRFYGKKEEWLENKLEKYDLNDIVKQYGQITRPEAIEKQRESQLLLLLMDNNNAEKSVYPAKVFEYFGAKRPIIAIGGQKGIISDLLELTNMGRFIESSEVLKTEIFRYYKEFAEQGEVRDRSNEYTMNYTYDAIANQYSGILNNIIS